MFAAREDFLQCHRAALRTQNLGQRFDAIVGWNEAERSLAQNAHSLSLRVHLYVRKAPEKEFRILHSLALSYARTALETIATFDSELLAAPDSTDAWSSIEEEKRIDAEIKERILKTTFESVPRNRAELIALLATSAGSYWTIRQRTGLTDEERCTEKPKAATVTQFAGVDVDQSRQPDNGQTTKIRVDVNADGSVHAAHILHSSGSEEHDTQAMSRIYQTTFAPARRKCKNLAGTLFLEY